MAAAEDFSTTEHSDYDLIISFNVHSEMNENDLISEGGVFTINKTKIVDVPTDCNITFLVAAPCGVSNFIDKSVTWTELLKNTIQGQLQSRSSDDLAQRIRPILIEENNRLVKQDIGTKSLREQKDKDGSMQTWNMYMDKAWQIRNYKKYYNKMYTVDPLDKVAEPFVVYYCRHTNPLVTKESVLRTILEYVEPAPIHAHRDVTRKTLIDMLTVGYKRSLGFKNILIIDASCSDYEGSCRDARCLREILEEQQITGGKRRRTRRARRTRRKRC
jgi:hypothetical protein